MAEPSKAKKRRPGYLRRLVERDHRYQAAIELARSHEPQKGRDYEWVGEYSREQYERAAAAVNRLDEKADAIVNYAAAFTGLEVVAFLYKAISAEGAEMGVLMASAAIPAFLLGVLAVCFAVVARAPGEQPIPPSPRTATDYADYYGEDAEARFAMHYNTAYVGARIVAACKGKWIRWASHSFIGALALLIVPLGLFIWFAS